MPLPLFLPFALGLKKGGKCASWSFKGAPASFQALCFSTRTYMWTHVHDHVILSCGCSVNLPFERRTGSRFPVVRATFFSCRLFAQPTTVCCVQCSIQRTHLIFRGSVNWPRMWTVREWIGRCVASSLFISTQLFLILLFISFFFFFAEV
jgi:hypothetical protein